MTDLPTASILLAIPFAHAVLRDHLAPGDLTLDATAGNGHDSLFLASLTSPGGTVFAFDIQPAAISSTRTLLNQHAIPPESVELFCASHDTFPALLPPSIRGHLAAAIFNLGYLPGSDKSCVTSPNSTLAAISSALDWLRPGGLLVAVLYPGHPGGLEESTAVRALASALPRQSAHAVELKALNTATPAPSTIVIRKS